MKVGICNIDVIVTGDWREPFAAADTIITEDGRITYIGAEPANLVQDCDVVIDAAGATVIPGLIDSQIHNTFGDYTPRQKTVGFLESYVHGGTTTSISALLAMSENTVKKHLKDIFDRLGVVNRAELAARFASSPPREDVPVGVSHRGRNTIMRFE